MPVLTEEVLLLDNFRLGQRRDGALREDKLFSLRDLVNYDILYTDGRLRIRPGYNRWNTNVLPAPAMQLYPFVDQQENFHLLGISNSRWYDISEAGTHTMLSTQAATARRPVVSYGNRVIFGTDTGLRWTDDASIGGANPSYRLGILRPDQTPGVAARAGVGNIVGVAYPPPPPNLLWWEINNTTREKIAAKFVCTGTAKYFGLYVRWMQVAIGVGTGQIRFAVYDDSGGKPNALMDDDLITDWTPIKVGAPGSYRDNWLPFQAGYQFDAGTTYWIVVEANSDYYSNYDGSGPNYFFVAFGYSAAPAGDAYKWDGLAWVASTNELAYTLGGLTTDDYYDYVITYFNSTYAIESRASRRSERVKRNTFVQDQLRVSWTAPTDPQVDRVRVYRRHVGSDPDVAESTITDTYKLAGEAAAGTLYYDDGTETDYLMDDLQTDDHYALDETDEDYDSLRPTAVIPAGMCEWKGRLIVFAADSSLLWMSKVLEENGATGLTGDNIPDYFTFESRHEVPEPSSILAVQPLSNNQLAIYMKNEAIWILYGGDEALNPPSDLAHRPVVKTPGLIGATALANAESSHFYLSRNGLYQFGGYSAYIPSYMSETNQSILNAIQRQYLADSLVRIRGREIWLAIDADNDGALETILILDLQRDVRSRNLFDRAWRTYSFGVTINDLAIYSAGSAFRQILAADSTTNYILEFATGTSDLGQPINAWLETHDMPARNLAMINLLEIDTYYPSTPPTYTVTLTDNVGNTETYTMTPSATLGAEDVRGHRIGVRLKRAVSVRLKLEQTSTYQDELRSILLGHTGE